MVLKNTGRQSACHAGCVIRFVEIGLEGAEARVRRDTIKDTNARSCSSREKLKEPPDHTMDPTFGFFGDPPPWFFSFSVTSDVSFAASARRLLTSIG